MPLADGAEKYSIAAEAKVVVVGKLGHVKETAVVAGWRIEGTIAATKVIFGVAGDGRKMSYEFLCSCCPKAKAPSVKMMTRQEGLWFLIPKGRGWTSAGSCTDPGWRPLEERAAFEEFYRKRGR
ncbi:MAG: hypothetical protein HZB13_04065 [Acidobacteria bacterium]|nr:hypothetical protein [Acidobacteriota bacterium]